jgi:hypothetical protein
MTLKRAREQIALANISKLDSARFTRTARGHARRIVAVADRASMSELAFCRSSAHGAN